MADEDESSSSGSDFDFGEDEEDEIEEPVPETWLSYSWYVLRKAGRKTHKAIVFVGEKLAWYLGITSPDWQYAIDIYEDMQREAREEKEAEERALREQQEEVARAISQMEAANTDSEDRTTTTDAQES